MNRINFLVVLLGVSMVLFGIVVDYLLPGTAAGVNPPQLLFIAAGLALALHYPILRRAKALWHGAGKRNRLILTASLITAVTLVCLEAALWLAGVSPTFTMRQPQHRLVKADWQTCDEAGCHYVYAAALRACESGALRGRVCAINQQGYADVEDFIWDIDHEDRPRILLLGDSYTFGMSADIGFSFADLLDAAFPDAVIWNLGHPGAGTNNAIAAFSVYGQILKPHLTILGFYNNDYDDNLLPIDAWLNTTGADGKAVTLRIHKIDDQENVSLFAIEDIEYWLTYSHYPPETGLERALGATQLGSILLRLGRANEPRMSVDAHFKRRAQVMRSYLKQLRDAVTAQGSEFLTLLIPSAADLGNPSMRYRLSQDITSSLEIPYLNPASVLDSETDYAPYDIHWNSSGHGKIGQLLSDCIERFLAIGDFSDCAHITLP